MAEARARPCRCLPRLCADVRRHGVAQVPRRQSVSGRSPPRRARSPMVRYDDYWRNCSVVSLADASHLDDGL